MDSSPHPTPWSLNCRGKLLTFSQPAVMGILNVNHDSFYEGSRVAHVAQAIERAGTHLSQGADILDIGAQSSRPGAETMGAKLEWEQLEPVLVALRETYPDATLSVDTYHAAVADHALNVGADIINDISGGDLDPELPGVVAGRGAPYVFMHMRGTPQTMQSLTEYQNVVQDVFQALNAKLLALRALGIKDLVADPGFGFGKTLEQNWSLMRALGVFTQLQVPLLVGVSRKSMLYKLLDTTPKEVLPATTAAHLHALQQGANILRVHDVAAAVQTRQVALQLQSI